MVDVKQVRKSYGAAEVLRDISFQVPKGKTIVIIGPSGSGKSTMLRCINHLEQINDGRIYVDGELIGYRESRGHLRELPGRVIARQRSEIGMVFQRFNLFPHMTALENVVEAPLHVRGVSRRDATERAWELLSKVG